MPANLPADRPPFLPFALPEIGEDEIAEVVDTLKSGWVTTGPKAKRFEQDFGAFLGDPALHAVAVNSATAGLHLALEALGIGPGDEVITTTHTFTATAEVVRYLGADVKLVDIDPATLNIDPAAVGEAVTARTKAIVPVHYAGLAADMQSLLELAADCDLKVVEDAAHALPTTCGGQLVGTLDSDATVFSFYANKTITTGEGGMLVTRDAALAQRALVGRRNRRSAGAARRAQCGPRLPGLVGHGGAGDRTETRGEPNLDTDDGVEERADQPRGHRGRRLAVADDARRSGGERQVERAEAHAGRGRQEVSVVDGDPGGAGRGRRKRRGRGPGGVGAHPPGDRSGGGAEADALSVQWHVARRLHEAGANDLTW